MSRNYIFCNNCGESGHAFHQCKKPITSMGTIVYRYDKGINQYKYLLICRKDTLGFVDFMRGKYPINDKNYIKNILEEMTIEERKRLVTQNFDTLWKNLWGDHIGIQYRGEEKTSRDKMQQLKNGINVNNEQYNLLSIIEEISTLWMEPEWGFPKGRRNYQEKNIHCALREFQEETGYDSNLLILIQNLEPFEEVFTGSNYKSYKHLYYLATLKTFSNETPQFQKSEVSNIEWLTFEDANKKIRPYNKEKLKVLEEIHNYVYEISTSR